MARESRHEGRGTVGGVSQIGRVSSPEGEVATPSSAVTEGRHIKSLHEGLETSSAKAQSHRLGQTPTHHLRWQALT